MKFDNKEVEFSINFVQDMIQRTGKLSPMVIGKAGEKRYVAPCMWKDDDEKYIVVEKAKELFRRNGVTEIIFMSEAWMKKVDKADYEADTYTRPSLSPDRIECAIISYLSENEKISVNMEMKRDGEKVSLGVPQIMVGSDFTDNLWSDYFKSPIKRRF